MSKTSKGIILVLTAGTFFLGYAVGHNSEPDYGNKTFQTTLSTDTKLWSQYEGDWHNEYKYTVFSEAGYCIDLRDALAEHQKVPEKKPLPFLTLHPEIQQQALADELVKVVCSEK